MFRWIIALDRRGGVGTDRRSKRVEAGAQCRTQFKAEKFEPEKRGGWI